MSKGNDDTLLERLLDAALDILRLSAYEKNKIVRRLQKLEKQIIKQLQAEELSKLAKRDLNKLLKNTSITIGTAYNEIASSLSLADIALFAADDMVETFQIYFGIKAIQKPKQDFFNSVKSDVMINGAPSSDWWRGQSADAQFKFKQQVRQGLIGGETNQEIIARIVGKSGQPGIMPTLKRNAASLVQTSVQTVANDARRKTFEANDDLVKGLRQVSTLDSHTSKVCMAYSGCQWDLNYKPIGPKNKQLPYNGGTPRHFNCRSVEVPITKTFKELGLDIEEAPVGQRASDEGPIRADITFDEFLKRKSKDYLDEKLGPGRAELFRKGKITLRDLVNGEGNPVSLEELKRLAARRKGG